MPRIVFDTFLLFSIFIFPWWVSFVLAVVGFFVFKKYFEYIATCIVLFLLYSYDNGTFWTTEIFLAIFTTFSYVAMMVLKQNIIYYKK